MRTILLLTIATLFTLPLAGQSRFFWSGSLDLDYHSNARTVNTGSADESSRFSKRAILQFSAALWSQRILRYTLLASVEESDVEFASASDRGFNLGYGIHLHLFPFSSNQAIISFGHNTYDNTREFSEDYSRKSDYLNIKSQLFGWRVNYGISESTVDIFPEDNRRNESGSVRKSWNWGRTGAGIDLRHLKNQQEYFSSDIVNQTARFTSNTDLPGEGNLWGELLFSRYSYSDTSVGLNSEDERGNLSISWNQLWSPRWETVESLKSVYSENINGADNSFTSRYRFLRNFRWDISLGYFFQDREEERKTYPYYGTGLYYDRYFGRWNLSMQGGLYIYDRDVTYTDMREEVPYGGFSISRQGRKGNLKFDLSYQGVKGEILKAEEITHGTILNSPASLTRDNLIGRFEYDQKLGHWFNLHFLSFYQQYDIENLGGLIQTESFSNQLDLRNSVWSTGVMYVEGSGESGGRGYDLAVWEVHGVYNLNTHLSFRGSLLERDLRYGEISESEIETWISFIYAAGKFSLNCQYQVMETSSEARANENEILRVTLMRRFGNVR